MQTNRTIPLSSATLIRFYKAWIADHPGMDRTTNGLCNCLEAYVDTIVGDITNEEDERWHNRLWSSLKYEMRKQFECAGLYYNFPFNCGYGDYALECDAATSHENPRRIQWVKDRIEDANNACIE